MFRPFLLSGAEPDRRVRAGCGASGNALGQDEVRRVHRDIAAIGFGQAPSHERHGSPGDAKFGFCWEPIIHQCRPQYPSRIMTAARSRPSLNWQLPIFRS